MSIKNRNTWNFAHRFCGKLWWKPGWILLILSVLAQILFLHRGDKLVAIVGEIICTVQCVVLILSRIPV